jgi:hypothetical protein
MLLVLVASMYIHQTVQRDFEWSNEKLLWEGAVKQCPKNFVSHVLLGNIYDKERDHEAALASFRESLVHNPAWSARICTMDSAYRFGLACSLLVRSVLSSSQHVRSFRSSTTD